AERMRRNLEVKAMPDRAAARPLVVSLLAHHTLAHAGRGMPAAEIAKAIATGFRTDLCDHVVSLDLLGSTVARHYVAWRPQCPACGRKKLRDPRRAPVPLEIGARENAVHT